MLLDYLSEKLWAPFFNSLTLCLSNVRAVSFSVVTHSFTFPLVLLVEFVEGVG